MHWIPLLILLLLLILGPQLWVRYVLNRYNRKSEENFPGNGAELARHLLNRYQLDAVQVERTPLGDHYDPQAKVVRMTNDKFEARTLTAIATAAHEVSHAVQDFSDYKPFRLRKRLVVAASVAQQLGSFMLFAAPLLGVITKVPAVGALTAVGAVLVMTTNLIVQLVTLPVEIDASFNRALPILLQGDYITQEQEPLVRKILRACAYSYVAAAAANLFNFWYWFKVLRR